MKRAVDLDRVGAIASAICAVHCLLTGVALGLLSIIGLGFMGSPVAEAVFIGIALLVGTWAVVHGIRKHGSWIPAAIFVLGLVFIAASHFLVPHRHDGGESADQVLSTVCSVMGGLSLVLFHILNRKLQHRCNCERCPHTHANKL